MARRQKSSTKRSRSVTQRGPERITISGTKIQQVYTRKDLPRGEALRTEPGRFPFTRGIHADMYRGRLWTMRQYAGFGTAEEANQRYRYLLAQGTTGLSIAFDLPTQMGRDGDHRLAQGEVGRVGVSVSSVEEMGLLLHDLPLDKVSLSMTINATAPILLAYVLVVAEEQGVPWRVLQGTVQNDILKEYIARGTYIYPPRPALRLITDVFDFCSREVPLWNTISVSGYHIREAGSSAVDEVAFTLANAITYLEAAQKRGLQIEEIAPRIAFFFNCQIDFFEEVAKFRAARTLWAKIMKKRFKVKNPRSMMLRFHTQTAGSSLTAQQPVNNVVRTTIEAMAAVLGGTQSLHTNSYDEALGLPTEESAKIALRTQQIIAFESGMPDTVDPLGGSYYVEALTAQIERAVMAKIERIGKLGGMVAAIEAGLPQRDIESAAYDFQRKVEAGERVIVGVNRFAEATAPQQQGLALNPRSEADVVARLKNLKARRDSDKVCERLLQLRECATSDRNLMPAIIAAARARATLGEVSDVLREVFGEYNPS